MPDQFVQVSLDLIPQITEALKSDPESIVHCQILQMYQRCKTLIPERDIRLYTPNGVVDEYGTNLLFVPDHRYSIMLHTTDSDCKRLQMLLLQLPDIDWRKGPMIGPVHQRFNAMIYCIIKELNLKVNDDKPRAGTYVLPNSGKALEYQVRYGIMFHSTNPDHGPIQAMLSGLNDIDWSMGPVVGPLHRRYYNVIQELLKKFKVTIKMFNQTRNYDLELEAALSLDVSVPEGTEVRPITLEHTKFINDRWPHKNPLSFKLIEDTIRAGGGYALFDKETGDMLSWALHALVGGVGMIKTAEEHRGKGLAKVVARAVTKKVAEEGITPQVQIRIDLEPSIKLFTSLGYKFTYHVDWHDVRGVMNP